MSNNIKEKYVFLVAANWFYGKGQEAVADIFNRMGLTKKDDFAVVFLFNSVKYAYYYRFLNNCKVLMRNYNCYFLNDLPREDVIAAFKDLDIFLFTSRKEVSPLVILESQAAGIPWVSMDVGDVRGRRGGIVICNNEVDKKGYKIINNTVIRYYLDALTSILHDKNLGDRLIEDGQEDIQEYDWNNIYQLYDEVFKK